MFLKVVPALDDFGDGTWEDYLALMSMYKILP